ncbi:DUF1376 domain-containing protein [Patescibacteria group bacterium]|nr:MAG: DUF1376 domain-containing protein [Patescibacteria group bacterium]
MDPDLYMPFYGNDFFAAVEGHGESFVSAYIRALWHYWHVNHCEGLKNDNGFLRRVCRCNASDWPGTGPVIFGEYFLLENGLWHQKRAREEWLKMCDMLERRRRAGSIGAKRRWKM